MTHTAGTSLALKLCSPGSFQFTVSRQRLRHCSAQLARPQPVQVAAHCLYHAHTMGLAERYLTSGKILALMGIVWAGLHVRVGVGAAVVQTPRT